MALPLLAERRCGVLLHPTSLPGPYGIGDLGPEAHTFLSFLTEAGQRWWQMLPIGPVGAGNSPYQSFSAFAGNPLLIHLETLSDTDKKPVFPEERVDYRAVSTLKNNLLGKAFSQFQSTKPAKAFQDFNDSQRDWLEDYALFAALKEDQNGRIWTDWPMDIRQRDPKALQQARQSLADQVLFQKFLQFEFDRQWKTLKGAAAEKGIGLIGDLPIFVSLDSADAWAYPEIFRLTPDRKPEVVAGVPPDLFSKTGQRWGNPLYDWDRLREQHYTWWIRRFRRLFELFDVVRLDHFIGFHRFWEIPSDQPTAVNGKYMLGPGASFFEEVFKQLPQASFIAEDLGVVVPEVTQLRDQFQLPGMKVLQFAFSDLSDASTFLPHNFIPNSIVYTGTHDNNTTAGWFKTETTAAQRAYAREYLGPSKAPIHWRFIQLAYTSSANVAIIPMQDLLGLGAAARMNFPGTMQGNWEWRMKPRALSRPLAKKLRAAAESTHRI